MADTLGPSATWQRQPLNETALSDKPPLHCQACYSLEGHTFFYSLACETTGLQMYIEPRVH